MPTTFTSTHFASELLDILACDHWEVEHSLGGAMGMLAHTAYHRGEIRQATCTVQQKGS